MENPETIKFNNIPEESINKITEILDEIKLSQKSNEVNPQKIFELYYYIKEIKDKNYSGASQISDLFTSNFIYLLRSLLLQERGIRLIILKILRNNIQIYPPFTQKLIDSLFPIAICKVMELSKISTFEERYECIRLLNVWLKYSDINFPLIFCQAVAAMSLADNLFKKGCIDFLRNLGIIRPDLCSSVGGFRILINCLLDEKYEDIFQNIFNSLLYIINSPKKENILMDLTICIKYFLFLQKVIFAWMYKAQIKIII